MRVVAVVPFLDEEARLRGLLDSLAAQERPPDQLLLVDDGSSDRSAEFADAFCVAHDWARLLRRARRPPERDRLASAAELRAFHWALEYVDMPWDILAKLDADMVLT